MRNQGGNVFTLLLGGIMMSAALGTALYQMAGGPVTAAITLAKRTSSDAQLHLAARMLISDAVNRTDRDCDSDDRIEPRAWRDTAGAKPAGGGLVPLDAGAPVTDAWGTDYGYCVWDVGSYNDPAASNGCGAGVNRLKGSPNPAADGANTQTVLAVMSAGPDKTFSTTCSAYVNSASNLVTPGGDDIVLRYTYLEAARETTSLWSLSSDDPGLATINKDLEVGDGATIGTMAAASLLTANKVIAGGEVIAGDEVASTAACRPGAGGEGMLRYKKKTLSVVQVAPMVTVGGTGNYGSSTLSFPSLPEAGNTIIVYTLGTTEFGGAPNIPDTGLADNQGGASGAYVLAGATDDDGGAAGIGKIFYRSNITAPAGTFTITLTPSAAKAGPLTWGAMEVAGLSNVAPVDRTAANAASGTGTSSTTVTTAATTQADELAVGLISMPTGAYQPSFLYGSGWTVDAVNNNQPGPYWKPGAVIHRILNATGAVSHMWTHAPTTGTNAHGMIATFKGAATASDAIEYCDGSRWRAVTGGGGGGPDASSVDALDDAIEDHATRYNIGLGDGALDKAATTKMADNVAIGYRANHEHDYTGATDVTAAADNGGLIRLTVGSSANYATGARVQVYGCASPYINAVWTVTNINGTTVDLQNSVWNAAYTCPAGTMTLSGGNVAIGNHALRGATGLVRDNIALGTNTMERAWGDGATAAGSYNVAAGSGALLNNSEGSYNVAIGPAAMEINNVTSSDYNVAIGNRALVSNSAAQNVGIGWSALMGNQEGARNTAFGSAALLDVGSGEDNTAIGMNALRNNTGSRGTAVGAYAGGGAAGASSAASDVTAFGYRALAMNEASENTAFGAEALEANATGTMNTAVGFRALEANVSDSGNTAIGTRALQKLNIGGTTTGNTAIGYEALMESVSGIGNTAFGYQSMRDNTTGDYNTAFGYQTLLENETGNGNTAFGYQSLTNSLAAGNTAIGYRSLYANTTGAANTAFGFLSLTANTSGSYNASLGAEAMIANTTGSYNTGFGGRALRDNTVGSYNTAYGAMALMSAGTSAGAGASISVVQAAPRASSDWTAGTSFPAPPTAGNTIIVTVAYGGQAGEIGAGNVTDNQGGTYTEAVFGDNDAACSYDTGTKIFYRSNIPATVGSYDITVTTNSPASPWITVGAIEATGVVTAAPVDATGTTVTFSAPTITVATSAPTTQNDTLAVSVVGDCGSVCGSSYVAPGGWTQFMTQNDNCNAQAAAAYQVLSATGTASHDWTTTSDNSGFGSIATFKASTSPVVTAEHNTAAGFEAMKGSAPVVVQSKSAIVAGNNGTRTLAFDQAPAAGNTIIAIVTANTSGGTTANTDITDNQGGASGDYLAGLAGRVFYRGNISAPGGAFTVSLATAGGNYAWTIMEVAGLANASPVDVTASLSDFTQATSATITTATTTQASGLAIGSYTMGINYGDTPPGDMFYQPGWTPMQEGELMGGDSEARVSTAYKIVSAAGAVSHTWTHPKSWYRAGGIAVFKAANGAIPTGSRNTAIGHQSLMNFTTASDNTAFGYQCMMVNATGVENAAAGYQSLIANASGSRNTAIGAYALLANTTGNDNTAYGAFALRSNTTGSQNTGFGSNALGSATTASNNTAAGYAAAGALLTGDKNVAIGEGALAASQLDSGNVAVGYNALGLSNNTAAIRVVQSKSAYNVAAGTTTLTFDTVPKAGNTIIVAEISDTCGYVFPANTDITDDQGGTSGNYTAVATGAGFACQYAQVFYRSNISAPAGQMTVSMVTAGGSSHIQWAILEVEGLAAAGVLDAALTKAETSSANPFTITGTTGTAQANELVLAFGWGESDDYFEPVWGWEAGWTRATGGTTPGFANGSSLVYKVYPTAGVTPSHTWTMPPSTNPAQGALMVAFKGANATLLPSNSGTPAVVQVARLTTTGGWGTTASLDLTFDTPPRAGNTIILVGNTPNTAITNTNITDNQGGTSGSYLLAAEYYGPSIYYRSNISAPSGAFTITIAQSMTNGGTFSAFEVSGLAAASVLDVTGTGGSAGGSVSTSISTSSNTTVPNSIAIAAFAPYTCGTQGATPAADWTTGVQDTNYGYPTLVSVYKVLTVTGPLTHTWTHPPANCNGSPAVIATFKASGAGAQTNNTAVGYNALKNNGTGHGNVAIGANALQYNTSGNNNTAIGYNAGPAAGYGTLSNTIAIGANATVTASDTARFGDTSITGIYGQVAWSFPSDRRFKKDIQDSDLALDFIMKLRPVSYRLLKGNGRLDYGFIAQEVQDALGARETNMVTRSKDAMETWQLRAADIMSPLVRAMQEQERAEARQAEEVAALKARLEKLKGGGR